MQNLRRIAHCALALSLLPALHAQGLLGTILGTVTDSSGASVGGASVKARSASTNLKRTRLRENVNLDFRTDAFNIFNHPDFDVPSVSTSLYSVTRSGNSITKVTVRHPRPSA
jgi:hypothetical protein